MVLLQYVAGEISERFQITLQIFSVHGFIMVSHLYCCSLFRACNLELIVQFFAYVMACLVIQSMLVLKIYFYCVGPIGHCIWLMSAFCISVIFAKVIAKAVFIHVLYSQAEGVDISVFA